MKPFERDGMTHVEWTDPVLGRQRRSLGIPWGSPPAVLAEKMAALFVNGAAVPAGVKAAKGPSLQVIYNKAIATHYAKQKDIKGVEGKWKLDLAPFFGAATPIQEVARSERIADFKAYLFAKGNHPKTVNRKLMVVSKLCKLAMEWGHIDRCPKMPLEDEDEGRVRWLSDSEEATGMAFLRAGAGGGGRKGNGSDPDAPRLMAAPFADLCEFLMDTGFRFNEAIQVEDRDFHFDRTPADVTIPAKITKSGKARTIGLTTRAAQHVYSRLRRDPTRHAELPGSSRPWGDFTHDRAGDLWAIMRSAMNLDKDEDFVIHALRHTFAVRMLEAGVDIRVLQYLMGHAKPETTAIYAHVSPRLMKGAVAALEARAKDVSEVAPMLKLAKQGTR
jgi:integrase